MVRKEGLVKVREGDDVSVELEAWERGRREEVDGKRLGTRVLMVELEDVPYPDEAVSRRCVDSDLL